ncbi:MAG: STAS-like domain-containing protein [Algoriphagus sp.]|uniref:STAS-like domain-containing protein n=1 Tax=Algoriphagus sp. TaxID=1872435 RepID=UPI003296B9C7
MKIRLNDIVTETYSNSAGYKLYIELKGYVSQNSPIELSFLGSTPTSSSFLNSSFGTMIEELGLAKFKALIKPVDISNSQASMLRHYINTFNSGMKA